MPYGPLLSRLFSLPIRTAGGIALIFILEIDYLCLVLPPKNCHYGFWSAPETTLANVIATRIANVEPFVRTYIFREFFIARVGNQPCRNSPLIGLL